MALNVDENTAATIVAGTVAAASLVALSMGRQKRAPAEDDEILSAIDESISRDRTVRIAATVDDVMDAAGGDYDIDWVDLGKDGIDIWGWTSLTPKDEQEWRLHLVKTNARKRAKIRNISPGGGQGPIFDGSVEEGGRRILSRKNGRKNKNAKEPDPRGTGQRPANKKAFVSGESRSAFDNRMIRKARSKGRKKPSKAQLDNWWRFRKQHVVGNRFGIDRPNPRTGKKVKRGSINKSTWLSKKRKEHRKRTGKWPSDAQLESWWKLRQRGRKRRK